MIPVKFCDSKKQSTKFYEQNNKMCQSGNETVSGDQLIQCFYFQMLPLKL